MSDYISDVFGDGGLFASRFPGYERRDGQVALARMVDEAMTSGRHALGEGPCGTGKSAAYCVPAIYHAHHSQATTVIVTANIALQEQLVGKDLPLLADLLPWGFEFALLKGRNNYLCLNRIEEAEKHGEFRVLLKDEQRQINDVLAWLKWTETGDVSELPFVPSPRVWSRFSAGIDDCKHDDCEFRNDCFAQRTRTRAKEADIIVTNYHMLFAHLAVRMQTGKNLVLPPFDYLVLDEAHEAADIAREFFGFTVSEYSFLPLAAVAEDYGDKELARQIRAEVGRLFAELAKHARSPEYKRRLTTKGVTTVTELEHAMSLLILFASNRATDSTLCERDHCQLNRAAERTRRVMSRLKEGLDQSDAAKIYWLELDAKGRARLRAKLLDVSSLLRAELFERCASVTLTSATLTTSGSFEFIRGQLGVPNDALETIAPSPFDFESQALLVVPEGISDPRTPEFVDAAAEAFRRVIELCDGRTLGLFTSYRNLNAVYDRLRGTRYRILRQGDLPRAELARVFKEDVGSVLLGTDSFWTGIDVPGESLTALVIDKLPFPSPDDPVIDAICERDPQAFNNYLVPLAIIALRQGVGRLIRCKNDFGVVVILDPRIAAKSYSRKFLASLPPMLTTRRIDNIARFLTEARFAHAC